MNLILGLSSSPLLLVVVSVCAGCCCWIFLSSFSVLSIRVGMNWFMTSFMSGMSIECVSSSSFTSSVLLLLCVIRSLLLLVTLFWLLDVDPSDGMRDVERRSGWSLSLPVELLLLRLPLRGICLDGGGLYGGLNLFGC